MQNNMQPEDWERLFHLAVDFMRLAPLTVRACRRAWAWYGGWRKQAKPQGFADGDGI
jgi:hypothetical protein